MDMYWVVIFGFFFFFILGVVMVWVEPCPTNLPEKELVVVFLIALAIGIMLSFDSEKWEYGPLFGVLSVVGFFGGFILSFYPPIIQIARKILK